MAEKLYYSMGEVVEMLDVSPSLVRFWEKRFDIVSPKKNKKGNRLFSPNDVRNLKTIYHLVKERGMTLAGAEKQLRARRSEIERDMEIAERLGAIRALLVEVRNELGGGGVIVDDTVAEDVAIEVKVAVGEVAAIGKVVEVEPIVVAVEETAVEKVVVPKPEPETEPQAEPETTPKPEPGYIEQTLF